MASGRKMKKLKDSMSLKGQLEEITMMDFRKSPGEVLTQTMLGKVFIITRSGRRCAVLSALPGTDLITLIDSKGETSYKNPARGWV